MSGPDGRVGVALLTMGEPEDPAEARPFLRALLGDRDLVRFPVEELQPAFAWAASAWAAGRFARVLSRIGGSPLVRVSRRQAAALGAALADDGDFAVEAVMRYGRPSSDDAVRRFREAGVASVVLIPLYPQFFEGTTGSSLRDFLAAMVRQGLDVPVRAVASWPDHDGFIGALNARVAETLARVRGLESVLLLCAHGLRESTLAADPRYRDETLATAAAVLKGFPGFPWALAWQNHGGRGWTAPEVKSEAARLVREGAEAMVAVPLSFVADNTETLYDLDIELRQAALAAGAKAFARVPTLGDDPAFVAALKDLALRPVAA